MDRCADMSFSVHTPKRTYKWLGYPLARIDKGAGAGGIPNPTYTPKRLCSASGGAYTASNVGGCMPRDLQRPQTSPLGE
ncbi:hypothetical protein Y032_0388g494 [Ancylostoma ceylanicum]|nr:hypothetical protein Y032_0388g494 [Ancylostoma ceylanicum]